ncbi:MAG: hypothetical protein JWQ79_4250, partial [Mucilaginibacter sp.]|nr:hypothetical protein [Mucilaginibacter sp.]
MRIIAAMVVIAVTAIFTHVHRRRLVILWSLLVVNLFRRRAVISAWRRRLINRLRRIRDDGSDCYRTENAGYDGKTVTVAAASMRECRARYR